jgi:hypothetical protein
VQLLQTLLDKSLLTAINEYSVYGVVISLVQFQNYNETLAKRLEVVGYGCGTR